jgi:hypothetical protein
MSALVTRPPPLPLRVLDSTRKHGRQCNINAWETASPTVIDELSLTPAVAARITNRVWTHRNIAALLD